MVLSRGIPFMSEFFLGNGGGFFNLPLLAFCPSLVGLEASAILLPELEATEEAAVGVSLRRAESRLQGLSHLGDHSQPSCCPLTGLRAGGEA
jgi:hypothetical protein